VSVLTYAELVEQIEDAIVGNVSTDAPIGTAEMLRAINDAYASVWEISGGGIKSVGSPTAWHSAEGATGIVYGLLSDIKEVLHLYASTTAPSVLTTTTSLGLDALTSAALFGPIKRGMHITGADIPANTVVKSIESTSSLTMSQVATGNTTGLRTFSDTGEVSGTKELDRRELSEVQWWKKSSLAGTYAQPKIYSVTRLEAGTPAAATVSDVGKLRLDYWPEVTGFYFPIAYIPQFTPMDGGSSDVPSVNDLESYDIAWMAAADLAPRIGRAELVPAILMKVSAGTQRALERKLSTLVSADQDR
jgi:hypothetical protein